ncbi:hypothetical protein [Caballeronia ptereochthonis]|uniref:hypothetical protein n=1 Tax=Caballeronia ptereochthonis TaxID=1777144 RepID=UPI00117F372D|nr:hypothetical protein [Caballeronia ptereochthonis]
MRKPLIIGFGRIHTWIAAYSEQQFDRLLSASARHSHVRSKRPRRRGSACALRLIIALAMTRAIGLPGLKHAPEACPTDGSASVFSLIPANVDSGFDASS